MRQKDTVLVNGVGSKGRRNERGARSEAECQERYGSDGGCQSNTTVGVAGGVGVGSPPPSPPSFLVLNRDNVNAELQKTRELATMWDYLEHKVRIERTHVIMNQINQPSVLRIMPTTVKSRYFEDGRLYMSRKIQRRLGRFNRVPGLMMTLTYDPKKVGKWEAWRSFGKDTRRFINAVNQYRRRRGWRRLHYFWVVEVQPGTGYPHLHIFFPNLKWIAPLSIINGNWRHGRSNIESPRKITVNCAAYISKYLRKMRSWSDEHLAMLWKGKCRMYSFSRGFSAKEDKKEPEWQRWYIIITNNPEEWEANLMKKGYVIDVTNEYRAPPGSLN